MKERILVVDDEQIIRESLSFVLGKEGYDVEEASDGLEAYEKILDEDYALLVTDLEMPGMKGKELLEKTAEISPKTAAIVVTAYGSMETAIGALRAGASDYILKPIEFDELLIKTKRILETKRLVEENRLLRKEAQRAYDFENIVGKSAPMRRVFDMIKRVARSDSNALVTGPSGVGKELVARALHFNGARKDKPFVPVNCGAIADNLMESEFFGHKKGAFTGAFAEKEGYLKAAEGGTLFLDEISETPLALQVKLLRVLQEKEYVPVGAARAVSADVRFVASTNRDLREEVEAGRFREDLYYRLNVVEIRLPSLNERREDVLPLADHFLAKYRRETNKNVKGFERDAVRALTNRRWRGEVRELENVVERAIIFCDGDMIRLDDLPESFRRDAPDDAPPAATLEEAIRRVERDYILRALEDAEGDKDAAAKALGLGLSTLYRKIKELGVDA